MLGYSVSRQTDMIQDAFTWGLQFKHVKDSRFCWTQPGTGCDIGHIPGHLTVIGVLEPLWISWCPRNHSCRPNGVLRFDAKVLSWRLKSSNCNEFWDGTPWRSFHESWPTGFPRGAGGQCWSWALRYQAVWPWILYCLCGLLDIFSTRACCCKTVWTCMNIQSQHQFMLQNLGSLTYSVGEGSRFRFPTRFDMYEKMSS